MVGIYIVALAALLHIGWAIDILIADKVEMTTPTAIYFDMFGDRYVVSGLLFAVSAFALVGKLRWDANWFSFWSVIPQQALLMLSAWSSGWAVYVGHYADGVVRSRHFLFDDQWQNIITMILHSVYVGILLVHLLLDKDKGHVAQTMALEKMVATLPCVSHEVRLRAVEAALDKLTRA